MEELKENQTNEVNEINEAGATEPVTEKKPKEITMRRAVNHTFKWLFVYNLLMMIVSGFVSTPLSDAGFSMGIATILCTGFVYLCTTKRWKLNPFAKTQKKMTLKDFCTVFGAFTLTQIITLGVNLITDAMGVQGTSISIGAMTVPLAIHVCIVGPFVEEMMYRGFTVGSIRRKGLIPAIVLSSLAFGLMHANLSQLVVGTLAGLVLGFVFSEYSIWWALVIHVINNTLGMVMSLIPQEQTMVAVIIVYGIFAVFAVYAVIQVIRRKDEVKEWFARPENRMQKGDIKGILTSVWFWLFAILYLGIAIGLMLFPQYASLIPAAK